MRNFGKNLLVGLFLFGLVCVPRHGNASDFDKKMILTFSGPVQIPGVTLDAGTYVVKRADPGGNPDVVRFFNADETHIYGTFIAIPDERMEAKGKPVVIFAETRGNAPPPIKRWWYPGDLTGEELVYPKGSNVLAMNTDNSVQGLAPEPSPMETAKPAPAPESAAITSEPAPEQRATKGEVEIAQATNPTPEPATPPAQKVPESLPKTASDLTLLALLGAGMFAGGAGVKALSKQKS